MVVVLPAPFGPRMPVTVPSAALSVSPSTAVVWPYRLTSPPISTAGICGTVLTDASLRRQEPAQRGGVDDLGPPREDPAQVTYASWSGGRARYAAHDAGSPGGHEHDRVDALASRTDSGRTVRWTRTARAACSLPSATRCRAC